MKKKLKLCKVVSSRYVQHHVTSRPTLRSFPLDRGTVFGASSRVLYIVITKRCFKKFVLSSPLFGVELMTD